MMHQAHDYRDGTLTAQPAQAKHAARKQDYNHPLHTEMQGMILCASPCTICYQQEWPHPLFAISNLSDNHCCLL